MLAKKPLQHLLVLVCITGSVAAQTLPRQGLIKPIWISVLPERPGRVYAMGLAAFTPSEAQALKQAQSNARVEVLTRLRANVKGETSIQSHASYTKTLGGTTTGESTKQISQDTQIHTEATELPGLAVEETWSDPDGRTAYALAYLDVPVADQELASRFDSVRKDLAQEATTPTDPRERLRKLQRLKKGQTELIKLDDMAGLLAAGGGDPALRSKVRDQKLAVERQMDTLRASLTLCISGDKELGVGADISTLVRNAVLKQGLGWAENGGEFTLRIRYTGNRQAWDITKKRWWEYQSTGDFVVARGVIEITLTDRAGTQYESTTIEAKGVGTSEFTADRALIKEYKLRLEKAIGQWLNEMVQ